jgi:modulator of FtsH protease HflK
MAWNEPGGGKDRDPWGNRGGDNGPPDLDEAFRKLQNQLSGLFGGRGGSGGDGQGGLPGFNPLIGAVVLGIALVGYFIAGIYVVDEQERGVVFRFGAVQEDVVMPGLRWYPPIIDRVERVNVTRLGSIEHEALMLTRDDNIVDISITVQFRVDRPVDFVVNVRNPMESLRQATESALRHVIGGSLLDQVITEGREAIGMDMKERLQSYLNHYGTGIHISTVNIDRSGPPRPVQAAFDEVQRAREDEFRFVNEATAYAESIIPEARGEAQQQIEQANAYRDRVIARADGEAQRFNLLLSEYRQAPQVTRTRLYIDAMETVLSNSSKVLVDVEGGNNMLYLPLDRIGRQAEGNSQRQLPRNLVPQDSQSIEEPNLLRRPGR